MAIPSFFLTDGFWGKASAPEIEKGKLNKAGKILLVAALADIVVTITTLVVGLLGVLGIVGLPAAASYALFVLGGILVISQIATTIYTKGDNIQVLKVSAQSLFHSRKSAAAA